MEEGILCCCWKDMKDTCWVQGHLDFKVSFTSLTVGNKVCAVIDISVGKDGNGVGALLSQSGFPPLPTHVEP